MVDRWPGLLAASALLGFLQPALAIPNAASWKFLAENRRREGVIALPSGLQYKVLRKGEGKEHPATGATCEFHYEGRTVANWPGGEVIHSTYADGIPSHVVVDRSEVIKGWSEAFHHMVEGDKWEVIIPPDLGWRDVRRNLEDEFSEYPQGVAERLLQSVEAEDVLVYTIELLLIKQGGRRLASTCDILTLEGCNQEEKDFVEKYKSKPKEMLEVELMRLHGIHGVEMEQKKKDWVKDRLKLLRRIRDDL